ncbi:unnamed protein product [Blumeria hordei]|uniref:Uncharacterized protein n=1 Tax=Blumeria hordei TaxID=2867405 RepID=A0A383UZY5_BLUHO|nr:unnamed protein product [Blumeria hordei]
MPSCTTKKTRFAPGTKSHGPVKFTDEVLDVAYLQGLLGAVKTGIENEKRRVRELSAHNLKLKKSLNNLRRDEEELIAKTKDLQRETRKEKVRTKRLRHKYQSARASQLMGLDCSGYRPLHDNHWNLHNPHYTNGTSNRISHFPANPHFVDSRGFVSHFQSQPPISQGPVYHQFQPSQPPQPPPLNYFHNPHSRLPGMPAYMGFYGPQPYSEWRGVPQYGYWREVDAVLMWPNLG